MSRKKYPKPIIKLCPRCMEFVEIIMDERYGRCPRCKEILWDKRVGRVGRTKKFHFKRIERKK